MRALALLALFSASCLYKPQFRLDEKRFSVSVHSTSVTKDSLINAYIEARNPTASLVKLVSVCDFYEDGLLMASLETKALVRKREIEIVRLNVPVSVTRGARKLRIACRHFAHLVKVSP